MGYLVNDLSLNGQYPNFEAFRDGIARIMKMRQLAIQYGRELYCHRNLVNAQVTPRLSILQVLGLFSLEEKRVLTPWLTKQGPFWEDTRYHKEDEYLECNENIVTDRAIGEAAYCCLIGINRGLVSFSPSSWEFSPIPVSWVIDAVSNKRVDVINYWDTNSFERALKAAPVPITSWDQLASFCTARFHNLMFTDDSFEPLRGHPFVHSAMNRILQLLDILNQIMDSRDEKGEFSAEGQQLYQDHFVGEKTWFSDSSESEKRDFAAEITFPHPEKIGEYIFCPWHGKVTTPQIRIHFPWPPENDKLLHVLYIGPKITKR